MAIKMCYLPGTLICVAGITVPQANWSWRRNCCHWVHCMWQLPMHLIHWRLLHVLPWVRACSTTLLCPLGYSSFYEVHYCLHFFVLYFVTRSVSIDGQISVRFRLANLRSLSCKSLLNPTKANQIKTPKVISQILFYSAQNSKKAGIS